MWSSGAASDHEEESKINFKLLRNSKMEPELGTTDMIKYTINGNLSQIFYDLKVGAWVMYRTNKQCTVHCALGHWKENRGPNALLM